MKDLFRGFALLLFALVLGIGMAVGAPSTAWAAEEVKATYEAPGGIRYTSYSPSWNTQSKLKELHEELLQNVHGEEIELLAEVVVHDDYPRGKNVAGQYVFQTVGLAFPNSKQKMQPGKIELYGGSEHTTVASLAHTLSHEYGHHVTHYYTLKTDGFTLTDEKRWGNTTYARMRGLTDDTRIAVDGVEHRWQIAEVAAEDYVQLFGSPLAKAPTEFESRVEQALRGEEPASMSWNASMFNVQPQENIQLPLASQVPGLYEFFHEKMKGDKGAFAPPAKPELNLTTYSKQGNAGYQLNFEWNVPGEKANYTYTLVTYEKDDHLVEPILTRNAGEGNQAQYGAVVVQRGSYIYTYQEPSAKGVRHFKLYAFGDNGWVSESPELTVDLNNPSEVTVNDKKVVPVEVPPKEPDLLEGLDLNLQVLDYDIDLSWLAELIGWVADLVNAVITIITALLLE